MAGILKQPKQWDAEQSVVPELATKLIETQFLELAPVSLELFGEGWDNIAYFVNQKFVFRFPRRQISVDLINIENSLLANLANQLPLPIPNPIYIGKPSEDYAWPFSGYQILEGQTACRAHLTHEERSKLAKPLAEFLKALHAIKSGAPDDQLRRLDVEMRYPKAHANLSQIEKLGLLPDMKPLFERLESFKHIRNTSPLKVLCHGDLYARHLLISPERKLCGIIDWGDAHLGNPAVDLSIVYSFLPPSARASFWEIYGTPDFNTQKLAEFRALFSASQIVVYAHDVGDADLLAEGLEALKFLIRPPRSVLPYDPTWAEKYGQEAETIKNLFGEQLLEIHHFGSTAIPGLSAKPIIDIMAVVPNIEIADQHTSELIKLGYEPRGSYVNAKHRIFQKKRDTHLHFFEPGDSEIAQNLAFKKHLIEHPEEAAYYSAMKSDLTEQYAFNAAAYRDHKDLYIKLLKYNPQAEPEISFKTQMLELLKTNPNCFERSSTDAHFTASAWLLNRAGNKALLMHHRKLDNWFQLGGHADGDPNLLRTAIKEAQEESGLPNIIAAQPGIFDIDIHKIPANSKDAAHDHYDVRFLLQVADNSEVQQNHESKELRWIGKNPKELPTQSESVVRMFKKWAS